MSFSLLIHSIVFIIYAICTLALTAYALHHFVLLYWLARYRRAAATMLTGQSQTAVVVTTHIPLYNEAEVAQRVIDAVAAQDYPRDRHQILVLDDSTDDTRQIVDAAVRRWAARGVDIAVVRRQDRIGYKAGALAH